MKNNEDMIPLEYAIRDNSWVLVKELIPERQVRGDKRKMNQQVQMALQSDETLNALFNVCNQYSFI